MLSRKSVFGKQMAEMKTGCIFRTQLSPLMLSLHATVYA
jgi:hypothetical protein